MAVVAQWDGRVSNTQFKLALALEASRQFVEAGRHIEDAIQSIRKRLKWLESVKANLEGAPRDKGKGRANDYDDVAANSEVSEDCHRRPRAIVPEPVPASTEEAAVEIEDLQGLLASLRDKVRARSRECEPATKASRVQQELINRGPLSRSVRVAVRRANHVQAEDLRAEAAESEASLKALAALQQRGPTTTIGFAPDPGSAAAPAAAAPAAAATSDAGVHDLSGLVRKRKPATEDDVLKRPKQS